MPGPRPELLFVSGPQQGQRAVLMRDVTLAGRSELADITLSEEFVSREQLQFQRLPEGWIVECVARSNPMTINGKRYKPGKQILLASGDVIAVGAKTEILFVDTMDDPNHVLAEYRRTHPESEVQPLPVEPVSPAPQEQQPPAPQPVSPRPVEPQPTAAKPTSPQKVKKTSSKARKYVIAFVVYLAVLAMGIVIFTKSRGSKDTTNNNAPPRLSSEEISDVLRSDLERSPNEVSAQRSLKQARTYFRHRTSERRNRYRCLLDYRLYKAYRRPENRTFQIQDERQYNQVVEELTNEVRNIYDRAWVAEMNRQWAKAKEQYELLLEYIPITLAGDDPEVRNILLENVMAHMRYVSQHRGKK